MTTLNDVEHEQFDILARKLVDSADGVIDSAEWVAVARHLWQEAPPALARSLREFRRDSGAAGVHLVRNVPVDAGNLPDTPMENNSVLRSATVSAASLMLIAHGLGDPAAFRPEKHGALVQNVVPVPGKEELQANSGSVWLTYHTENAFHEHRPDFVMLVCVRPDHAGIAELRTVCAREVLPKLSESAREALFERNFVTEPPPSFGLDDGATEPHAVFHGDPYDPDMQVDEAATKPLTEAAAAAMRELNEVFDNAHRGVRLGVGDLAIVDNRVTVHGRSAFTPRYDGQDRWLQRLFALADFRRSRGHRRDDGYVLG